MNIKNGVEKLESRRPRILLAVIEDGEDPDESRHGFLTPAKRHRARWFTGVPHPRP